MTTVPFTERLQPALAGTVTATVGFASSFTVVLTGLRAVGADQAQAASGLLALGIACGLVALGLGLRYRMPISIAWSTPGAALLAAVHVPAGGYPAAVGAFVFCGLLVVVTACVPAMARLVAAIPAHLGSAMLAGVLLPLCLAPLQALAQVPLLAAPVIAVWALVGRFARPWAVPAALVVAVAGIVLTGPAPVVTAPALTWTTPTFAPETLIGIGLPLYLVTMASQNVPGMAVLAQYGFRPPLAPLLGATGAATLVAAPFGGFTVNLAAISAALAAGPDAGPAQRRWIASAVAGIGLAVLGIGAGVAAALLAASPPVLVEAVAGLALLGALAAALSAAVAQTPVAQTTVVQTTVVQTTVVQTTVAPTTVAPTTVAPTTVARTAGGQRSGREAAAVTFVVTAAGVGFLGLGSAFWGLLAGAALTLLHRPSRSARAEGDGPA